MTSNYLYIAMEKAKLITVRMTKEDLIDFHAACSLRGISASGWLHQYAIKTIREEKERDPELFKQAQAKAALKFNDRSDKRKLDSPKSKAGRKKQNEPKAIDKYQDIPQKHLFSDGTGKPVKKFSRKIKSDIEDAKNEARRRTDAKLKPLPPEDE